MSDKNISMVCSWVKLVDINNRQIGQIKLDNDTLGGSVLTMHQAFKNLIKIGFSIIDAVYNLNLVKSRSEIKRLIKSKGIKINDNIYIESDFSLDKFIEESNELKITVGKKKIGILKFKKNI